MYIVYYTFLMVSLVSVEIWMCIYVYYTVVLVPGNSLCSYCGNLKNACVLVLYLHSGAHS